VQLQLAKAVQAKQRLQSTCCGTCHTAAEAALALMAAAVVSSCGIDSSSSGSGNSATSSGATANTIDDAVVQQPVMEAFANAKAARNNSSESGYQHVHTCSSINMNMLPSLVKSAAQVQGAVLCCTVYYSRHSSSSYSSSVSAR
jgi:hypothetical protein